MLEATIEDTNARFTKLHPLSFNAWILPIQQCKNLLVFLDHFTHLLDEEEKKSTYQWLALRFLTQMPSCSHKYACMFNKALTRYEPFKILLLVKLLISL